MNGDCDFSMLCILLFLVELAVCVLVLYEISWKRIYLAPRALTAFWLLNFVFYVTSYNDISIKNLEKHFQFFCRSHSELSWYQNASHTHLTMFTYDLTLCRPMDLSMKFDKVKSAWYSINNWEVAGYNPLPQKMVYVFFFWSILF